ncbi:MAG: hypothetical protein ACR2MO_04410 [Acidimicrobiales bacterium]
MILRRWRAVGKRAVGLGLVVLACMALVACGNDGDGGGERLSAAQLTTKGDAVCEKLDADVKTAADTVETGITFTPEKMQEFYTKLLPVIDDAVEGFKALEPPQDLEDAYDSAIEQIQIDRKTLAGATNSPDAAKKFYDTGVDPFTATGQKLAAAGITACGSDAAGDTTTTTAAATDSTTATTTK